MATSGNQDITRSSRSRPRAARALLLGLVHGLVGAIRGRRRDGCPAASPPPRPKTRSACRRRRSGAGARAGPGAGRRPRTDRARLATTRNSSPAYRTRASEGRNDSRRAEAKRRRVSSPAACPWRSLICLNSVEVEEEQGGARRAGRRGRPRAARAGWRGRSAASRSASRRRSSWAIEQLRVGAEQLALHPLRDGQDAAERQQPLRAAVERRGGGAERAAAAETRADTEPAGTSWSA